MDSKTVVDNNTHQETFSEQNFSQECTVKSGIQNMRNSIKVTLKSTKQTLCLLFFPNMPDFLSDIGMLSFLSDEKKQLSSLHQNVKYLSASYHKWLKWRGLMVEALILWIVSEVVSTVCYFHHLAIWGVLFVILFLPLLLLSWLTNRKYKQIGRAILTARVILILKLLDGSSGPTFDNKKLTDAIYQYALSTEVMQAGLLYREEPAFAKSEHLRKWEKLQGDIFECMELARNATHATQTQLQSFFSEHLFAYIKGELGNILLQGKIKTETGNDKNIQEVEASLILRKRTFRWAATFVHITALLAVSVGTAYGVSLFMPLDKVFGVLVGTLALTTWFTASVAPKGVRERLFDLPKFLTLYMAKA